MLKIWLFNLLVCILLSNNIFCQEYYKHYYTNFENKSISLILSNNKYELSLTEHSEDTILEDVLSRGDFVKVGNNFNLIDNLHLFRMTFEIKDDVLIPKNTFKILMGRSFIVDSLNIIEIKDKSTSIIFKKQKLYMDNIQKNLKKAFLHQDNGIYSLINSNNYIDLEKQINNSYYKLELNKQKRFKFILNGLTLLEGKYSNVGRVLYLNDKFLKMKFGIIVLNKNLLKWNNLFCEYQDCNSILKKNN